MSNSSNESNNKRIAKNTVMLYIRMLLSIIVSLYTSRVVLNTLGVEDYGIYNVVGGVVAMFTFLNSSMSGATSRFLTFEMGKKDFSKLKDVFSSAFTIHFGIAILILIIAETFGLWLLGEKLVIPDDRVFAANIVYQCSILSMLITITQVPYSASIISHERMDVYAYVELLNVFLKLGIVYILLVLNTDKLILYAVLVLAVTILINIIYRIYCIRHFSECRWSPKVFKWDIIKPMVNFSCLDLYGNMSVSARQYGTSILLNTFFGPVLNAANGLATTVHGIILGFANNVITAFRPQIIKKYAENNIKEMSSLMVNASKFSICLFLFIGIPFYFEIDYVLELWLGIVPEHTAFFLKVVLLCSLFRLANSIINIGIHATGNIKSLSFITGSLFLLNIPVLYLLLWCGFDVDWVYTIMLPFDFLILCSVNIILKNLIHEIKIKQLVIKGYLPGVGLIIIDSLILVLLQNYLSPSFSRLVITVLTSSAVSVLYIYFIVLNKSQKEYAINLIRKKLHISHNQ